MSMEKRMILAVAVSFIVIVVWSMVFSPSQPVNTNTTPVNEETANKQQREEVASDQPEESGDAEESSNLETEEETIADVSTEEMQKVTIETNRYVATLSNKNGGSIESFKVKRPYGDNEFYEASFSTEPLDLVAAQRMTISPFSFLGTVLRDGNGGYREFPGLPVLEGAAPGETVSVGDVGVTITFRYRDEKFGRLSKEMTFYNDTYVFDVRVDSALFYTDKNERLFHTFGPGVGDLVKLKDDGAFEPAKEANGFLIRKGSDGLIRSMSLVTDRGELGAEEEALKEQPVADLMNWAGLENNYFMTLAFSQRGEGFIPVNKIIGFKELKQAENTQYFNLPLMSFQTFRDSSYFKIYSGPKDLEVLEKETIRSGEKLEDVVAFGWFAFISRPALWVLKQLYSVFGNYGFAIVLLTILINVLMLPLIISQRKSMAAMQKLQPQMKSLQAKYKVERGDDIKTRQDKKQKLNEEMMALYKQENVNPMGGCLPLLIQMPILLALLDMFRVAIELRKEPFVLWLQNLSTPDPTFVLPVLMAVTMFLQQRMTPTPTEGQAGALKLLPFVFLFVFISMPSGLVLYWFTSSLFNLGTQTVMNKINPVRKEDKSSKPAAKRSINKPASKGRKKK
jgi:YidC/Oxa1 family membrane protein insertase